MRRVGGAALLTLGLLVTLAVGCDEPVDHSADEAVRNATTLQNVVAVGEGRPGTVYMTYPIAAQHDFDPARDVQPPEEFELDSDRTMPTDPGPGEERVVVYRGPSPNGGRGICRIEVGVPIERTTSSDFEASMLIGCGFGTNGG